jgi:hypothetical protein
MQFLLNSFSVESKTKKKSGDLTKSVFTFGLTAIANEPFEKGMHNFYMVVGHNCADKFCLKCFSSCKNSKDSGGANL